MQLFVGQTQIAVNDNWQDGTYKSWELFAIGYQPLTPYESGLLVTLSPGNYTTIVSNQGPEQALGLFEAFVITD